MLSSSRTGQPSASFVVCVKTQPSVTSRVCARPLLPLPIRPSTSFVTRHTRTTHLLHHRDRRAHRNVQIPLQGLLDGVLLALGDMPKPRPHASSPSGSHIPPRRVRLLGRRDWGKPDLRPPRCSFSRSGKRTSKSLTPFADDLARCIETGSDHIVGQAGGCEQDDPGTNDITIR